MNRTEEQKVVYSKIKEILLNSSKPSDEIKKLITDGDFENYPFKMIVDLKNIQQNRTFHREGNVYNHTMLVIDKASALRDKSDNELVFMLSALLHDLGKLTTTKISKAGKITSYNHDKASSKLVNEFLVGFESKEIIKGVYNLSLFHMQSLYYQHNANTLNVNGIIDNVDLNDLCLLTIADRTGRLGVDEKQEIELIKKFIMFLEENKYK